MHANSYANKTRNSVVLEAPAEVRSQYNHFFEPAVVICALSTSIHYNRSQACALYNATRNHLFLEPFIEVRFSLSKVVN